MNADHQINSRHTFSWGTHRPPSSPSSQWFVESKGYQIIWSIKKSMWSDFSFYFLGWNINPRTQAFHFPRFFTRGFCKFIFVHRATHFSAAGRKLRDMALADWFRASCAVEEESNKRNSFVDSTSAFRDSLCNRWMNDTKKIGTTDGKSVARLDSIWMVLIQTGTRLYSYWSQKRAKFDKRAFCGAQFHFRKFNFSIGVKVLLQTSPLTWELNGRRPVRCHFSSVWGSARRTICPSGRNENFYFYVIGLALRNRRPGVIQERAKLADGREGEDF